eukprot:7376467-Prymnesium_polylepis.2
MQRPVKRHKLPQGDRAVSRHRRLGARAALCGGSGRCGPPPSHNRQHIGVRVKYTFAVKYHLFDSLELAPRVPGRESPPPIWWKRGGSARLQLRHRGVPPLWVYDGPMRCCHRGRYHKARHSAAQLVHQAGPPTGALTSEEGRRERSVVSRIELGKPALHHEGRIVGGLRLEAPVMVCCEGLTIGWLAAPGGLFIKPTSYVAPDCPPEVHLAPHSRTRLPCKVPHNLLPSCYILHRLSASNPTSSCCNARRELHANLQGPPDPMCAPLPAPDTVMAETVVIGFRNGSSYRVNLRAR